MARIVSPDLSSPGFKADPHPFYARLRAEAPVYRTRLSFLITAWIVTRYDDAVFVLKDGPFSNALMREKLLGWLPQRLKALTRHVLSADPPDHIRLRTLVSQAFTPRSVELLRGRIQSVCDALLDAAAEKHQLELVGDFALRLPLTIIEDLLGIRAAERGRFDTWARRVAAGMSGALPDLVLGMPALWQSVGYLRGLIARRRADPQDDMVTALLQAEEAGDKLSEDEVIGMIGLLLLAGFETTMGLIAGGTLALLRHPEQRRRFTEESTLADSAIEELLRYTSPLDFAIFRIARENVTIAGVTIPKGDVVLAALGSANRDASRFPNPDTLDLARDPNKHLAFGAGGHFCLGAPLARMEGRIALTTLFRRFPDLRLAEPTETVRWRKGLSFRGPARMQLVFS